LVPRANPGLPLFITGCFMTLAIIFVDIFIACMKKSHLLQDIDELTADCDDVDYFSAVPLSSRKSWLAGEL